MFPSSLDQNVGLCNGHLGYAGTTFPSIPFPVGLCLDLAKSEAAAITLRRPLLAGAGVGDTKMQAGSCVSPTLPCSVTVGPVDQQ